MRSARAMGRIAAGLTSKIKLELSIVETRPFLIFGVRYSAAQGKPQPNTGRDAFHRVPIFRANQGRGGTRPYRIAFALAQEFVAK